MSQNSDSDHLSAETTTAPREASGLPGGGPLAASLTLIAALHGRRISRDALLSGLPMENGVLTPTLFSRAAKRAGLASKIIKSPLERINGLLCPAVLILGGSRACVVTSIDAAAEKASVIFPGDMDEGTAELPFETLRDIYTGYVIYLKPQFKFDERAGADDKRRKGHWFWETLATEKNIYRDVIIASLLSNIFAFAMPLFVMNVYNRVVPNNAVETLWVMAIGVFIMITADFALHMARGYLTDLAASRTNTRLSADMMEQVMSMRSEARPASVGSMVNSIQGFDSVRSFISSATVFAYVDLPFSIFFIIVIAVIAWPLAIPILIGGLLVLAEAVMVQKQMRELSETTNRASSLKNATMVESLVAIESVKTQNLESTVQNRWEKTVAHLEAANVKMRLLSSAVISWTQWINVTISIATMVIGVYLIRANAISMGSLIAAYMLSSRAMMPISRVAGLLMQYYSTSRSLSALDDIMNKETEHEEGVTFLSRPDIAGGIQFRDVGFTYPEQERPALSALNFTVKPGEHVAIVGPIGSGKSTLFKLILKLFRQTEGSILIDGTDSRQMDPAELRRAVGVVPQEVMLFYGTLRDNLVMGNPYITDQALLQAIQISGVDGIVKNHPKGFDMQVGERGANLSSGQRQAVAIARAVLKNPSLLLLDEPTSAMDSRSEERVRHNLKIFARDKTLLLVTHRTALLDLTERVIVLDGGRIVADGPKEQILAALKEGAIGRAY
ncbi:type I secretion system permease/ATPase [Cloacibacillus porcorum]|uniref:type I secretion system permease/ATPase n=1 Tax=Cloacibacillus porcorum TaxID=1197717 RepID=UPI001459D16F|nr:type I secretion system permease/ATPase [Cloacibacillus porcorum]MCC8185136.1 type I secretion system permease/ATPase [Cloacibacillus porcorum]MDY5390842.1 type I secretion system permease/ATPase [Cloacibacillus porcorum]NMF19195.1 type I secretion system permease/ATPase [Cloacibacillus porcorum]